MYVQNICCAGQGSRLASCLLAPRSCLCDSLAMQAEAERATARRYALATQLKNCLLGFAAVGSSCLRLVLLYTCWTLRSQRVKKLLKQGVCVETSIPARQGYRPSRGSACPLQHVWQPSYKHMHSASTDTYFACICTWPCTCSAAVTGPQTSNLTLPLVYPECCCLTCHAGWNCPPPVQLCSLCLGPGEASCRRCGSR